MKKYLFSLKRNESIGWDENANCVIAAKDETQARQIANTLCRDEGKIWDNTQRISCDKIGIAYPDFDNFFLVDFNSSG